MNTIRQKESFTTNNLSHTVNIIKFQVYIISSSWLLKLAISAFTLTLVMILCRELTRTKWKVGGELEARQTWNELQETYLLRQIHRNNTVTKLAKHWTHKKEHRWPFSYRQTRPKPCHCDLKINQPNVSNLQMDTSPWPVTVQCVLLKLLRNLRASSE